MKMKFCSVYKLYIIISTALILLTGRSNAQTDSSLVSKFIKKTEISAQWFLGYSYDISADEDYFNLKRGYFTVKTDLSPAISVRYTQDITIDQEGSDAGNVEIRMKYLYMKLKPFKSGFFKDMYAEIGLVHRPWLDFEQKINDYRVQGTMFLERMGIFNSADFGITVDGLIGGKMDQETQKRLGSHYPGKYGSYSFGIYNGAGYHDNEKNHNKVFENRISVRPFPEFFPGLQVSYSGAYGKANIESRLSDFRMHLIYLSLEDRLYTFTGQYYSGLGDSYGSLYNENIPYKNEGYSVFGEVCIPRTPFSLLSRYDYFQSRRSEPYKRTGFYFGTAYRFLNNKLLLSYSRQFYPEGNRDVFETVLEIAF
jgi:hypothetical protein